MAFVNHVEKSCDNFGAVQLVTFGHTPVEIAGAGTLGMPEIIAEKTSDKFNTNEFWSREKHNTQSPQGARESRILPERRNSPICTNKIAMYVPGDEQRRSTLWWEETGNCPGKTHDQTKAPGGPGGLELTGLHWGEIPGSLQCDCEVTKWILN